MLTSGWGCRTFWVSTEHLFKDIHRKCAYMLFHSVMSNYLQRHGWTIACQSPLSTGFPGQEHVNGLSISYSRGSSWSRASTYVSWDSCFGRWILYHWVTWEAPSLLYTHPVHMVTSSDSTKRHTLQRNLTLISDPQSSVYLPRSHCLSICI